MQRLDIEEERHRLDDLQRRIDHAKHDLAEMTGNVDPHDEIPYRHEGRYGPVDETTIPPG